MCTRLLATGAVPGADVCLDDAVRPRPTHALLHGYSEGTDACVGGQVAYEGATSLRVDVHAYVVRCRRACSWVDWKLRGRTGRQRHGRCYCHSSSWHMRARAARWTCG
jgi:hypothetical protein